MSEKDVIRDTKPRMEAVIDDVRRKLATVRTGRAAANLMDSVVVEYYEPNSSNPDGLVHVPEPQMITVQPWDQSQLGAIEKAIRSADWGDLRTTVRSFEFRYPR